MRARASFGRRVPSSITSPFRRFFTPFSNYRKHIATDLAPSRQAGEMAVIGINTMSPWRWQTGWASRRGIRRAARLCAASPPDRLNVIVAHHPFELPSDSTKSPMINAEWGLRTLAFRRAREESRTTLPSSTLTVPPNKGS